MGLKYFVLIVVTMLDLYISGEPYTPSNGYRLEIDPNAIAAGQAAAVVDNQIATNSMVIYAKSWCRYCQSVKRELDARYKDYKFAYVDSDLQFGGDEIHQAASQKSNMRTVPQIWVCGRLLGGADKFDEADKAGQLRPMWNQCASKNRRIRSSI